MTDPRSGTAPREMSDRPDRDSAASAPLIRVVDTDRATIDLLNEWLLAAGFGVALGDDDGAAALTIMEVPFTRHGGREAVQRVADRYPGVPILALSPTFFSNVQCGGNCAQALGVDGVLPKPVPQDALIAAIRKLLHERG
jgi:CheY-like chemotaxis protein